MYDRDLGQNIKIFDVSVTITKSQPQVTINYDSLQYQISRCGCNCNRNLKPLLIQKIYLYYPITLYKINFVLFPINNDLYYSAIVFALKEELTIYLGSHLLVSQLINPSSN